MRTLQRDVPAPAGWRTPTAEVPAGSTLQLDLRLESVVDGVLVSGVFQYRIEAECSRCLDPVSTTASARVQELYLYPDQVHGAVPTGEGTVLVGEEELRVIHEDAIDLEPLLRDIVVPDLPLTPLCSQTCQGLCPDCGVRLADDPDHAHDRNDPRWSALADWS